MKQNIWFTADTHYYHQNIVRGCSKWSDLSPCRPFDTLEEHNTTIVNNINQLVKTDDVLYHLGDWSFGNAQNIKVFRNLINCQNIHLILGNHDQDIRSTSSIYRGCFNSVQNYKEVNYEPTKQKFVLSHYSHRVWNNSHRSAIHLYGHSHGTLPGLGKSMDVGIDTNNYYPYHIDEIIGLMDAVPIHQTDHHIDTIK